MAQSLEEIQDDLLNQVHAGEDIDRAALLAAHPEHAADLGAFLDLLDVVEGTGEAGGVPPSSLGEFRILREIGRGGMGVVYEAEQASLKRRVALKVLPPALRMDTRLVKRFRREAEAAGRLSHPGIVPVFGVGQAGDTPFFAMEFVPGSTLREILRERKAGGDAGLPTAPDAWRRWAVETCAAVADALAYAHGEGILHRDVKPANILINAEGAPRLTDFGLAQDLRSPGLSLTGEILGSPQYMSPEQAIRRDTPVDERTDIYSLAVTLYQLLTLHLPYPAETHAELLTALAAGRVIPPRQVDPDISRSLEQVLLRALRRNPQERYGDAAAFAADLRAAIEGRKPAYREPLLARKWVPVGIALAAAGVLAIVLLNWPQDTHQSQPPTVVGETTPHPVPQGPPRGAPEEAATPPPADDSPVPPARSSALQQLTALMQHYHSRPRITQADFQEVLAPLLALADSEETPEAQKPLVQAALRQVYTDYIAGPGSEDAEARAFLGYRRFEHEVPEAISNRGYDFLRAVEWATEKVWFAPEETAEFELAERAWERTERHLESLVHDAAFNRGDRAAALLVRDKRLAPFHLTSRWSSPYLICYVAPQPTSPFDALTLEDPAQRRKLMRDLEVRNAEVETILNEEASLFGQLYAEYMHRYEKVLDLKPLMAPWGGRPDYPAQFRSYRDGVPLVVLVFANRETFRKYEVRPTHLGGLREPQAYFSPVREHVCLFRDDLLDADATDGADAREQKWSRRGQHARTSAVLGTYQLEFWFSRQQRRWRKPPPREDFFRSGFAAFFGAVTLRSDGRLLFDGLSRLRLTAMQSHARLWEKRGRHYPVFPLLKLLGFGSATEARAWGSRDFRLDPDIVYSLCLQQYWAFIYFLNKAEQGRYRIQFDRMHKLTLGGETGLAAGEEAFRLRIENEWAELDRSFHAYIVDHLLKLPLPEEAAADAPSDK